MGEKLSLSKEKTGFETEHPDISQDIKILKYVLLPLEYWCLRFLFLEEKPLSTGQIYNRHVLESASENNIYSTKERKEGQTKDGRWFITYSPAKDIRALEKELRQKKIKFHSYKFIKQTLEKLENWGILATREAEVKSKTDLFWLINPKFFLKYNKQLESLFKGEEKQF